MIETSSRPRSGGGYFGFISSSVSMRMLETTRLRYHLRLAATTYQGAKSVEVRSMAFL